MGCIIGLILIQCQVSKHHAGFHIVPVNDRIVIGKRAAVEFFHEDAAIVVDGMKGIDENDQTSWNSSNINLYNDLSKDVKGKKLFYIKEITDISNYPHASNELKVHL